MSRLRRLPIRHRVTLVFIGAIAIMLVGVGLFVYDRLDAQFDATIGRDLRARADDVAALARETHGTLTHDGRSVLSDRGESLAQVLDGSGRVLDSVAIQGRARLLDGPHFRRALRGTIVFTSGEGDTHRRLLATPVRVQGRRVVVVVGTNLDQRDDAINKLAALLLVGGGIALLLAALAGSAALAAALRPVEEMRRRAEAIQDMAPGQRLPVPEADDEIRRLGDTLNAMLARLEEAFAHERRFLADASHELRTPLAILKAELELARRDGRTIEELEAAIRSAAEETDRLVQLAEDLLVIARADQGMLPIRAQRVPAAMVLDGVARRFAQRAAEHGAIVDTQADPMLELSGDPLRLEQALGNLVDNALRYGGRHIRLSAETAGERVELHVRDDGAGFPPAFLASAFDRFARADAARGGGGGAGLGLSIVAVIARAHGGDAGARNGADGGADVWLSVPVASPIATAAT